MWNIYLYFIILKLFNNFQNIIVFVKIVANAPLSNRLMSGFKYFIHIRYNAGKS
jgi:hypothetical protein